MCGIAGTVGPDRRDADLVRRMCDVIAHRGPDGEGYHVDERAVLGMRRLAIIDVAGGQQPVSNEDGTIFAVFNGEIYNFPELRRRLSHHRFRTAGDSECLVHLYEEYGDDLVHHLRGMFAFALWDTRRGRLLLARDRVGKKPLYWRPDGAGLAFASEAKSLVEDPRLARRVDLVALHHYLTYQYVPAPWSIFDGVRKLPPGHLLTWQAGRSEVREYWRLDCSTEPVPDEAAAAQRLRELLLDAVRVRLVSERPLGAFLSGGVDSSAVVAAMAQQSAQPVKTFSIGFDDERFDERVYARLVARRYGTEHHELVVTPSAADLLPELAWHFDEPFADASAIPSYYVARLSREHVTVVLNGDGGDECFGGYERYALMRTLGRYPTLRPGGLFRAAGTGLVQRAPAGTRRRAAGRALQVLGTAPEDRYGPLMSIFSGADKFDLYSDDLRAELGGIDSLDLLRAASRRSAAPDPVGRFIDADIHTYLPGDLLTKVDISTMANSIEARSPLLDHHLLEWAGRLPTRLKVNRRGTKYLFKAAMAPWLPPEILHRRKQGFGVPLASWLRGELRDLTHGVLTDDTARGRGLFRPAAVAELLDRHDRGLDESRRLWALVQFELWHRRFLDPAPSAPAAEMDGGVLARQP